MMSIVKVEYVGLKPVKTDNVAGTDTVWQGQGDVQEVSEAAWAKLSKHPDIWRLAGEQPKTAAPPGVPDAEQAQTGGAIKVGLAALDRDQLQALAKDKGVRVHPNAGADTVRAKLAAAGV